MCVCVGDVGNVGDGGDGGVGSGHHWIQSADGKQQNCVHMGPPARLQPRLHLCELTSDPNPTSMS